MIYPNNLKNWEFDKEAPQIFCPEQGPVFIDTARGEDEKSGAKPTQSKTNFSSCLGITVFDLDHTLIEENSSFQFCRYLAKAGVLPFSSLPYSLLYYFQHRFLGLPLSQLHERVFARFLKGRSKVSLEKYAELFVKERLSKWFYMPAVDALRRAQHLGHYTLILSNSPSFLVKAVAKFLHVDAFLSTEYATDQDLCFSHIASLMEGREKAQNLERIAQKLGAKLSQTIAYSDSFLDLPLLLAAGRAVVVNPDKKLRAFSTAQGWSVI